MPPATKKRRLARSCTRAGPSKPAWSHRANFPAEIHSSDVQEVVAGLNTLCSVAGKSGGVLQHEQWVLQRLIYRNTSQHRRSDHFQKLLKLKKMLVRLEELHLVSEAEAAVGVWPEGSLVGVNVADVLDMPSRSILEYNLQKLQDATALLDATVAHCNLTFVSIHRRIAKALFMPLNLTFASLVSRIAAVASHLRSTVAATYAMIRPCLDWASSRDVDGGGNPLPWTLPLPNKSGDSVLREMTSAVQKNEEDGAAEIGVGSLGDDEEGITAENGNQNAGSGTVLAAAAAACDGDSHDEMDVLFGGGASVVINRSEYRIARGSNTCNQNPKAEATLKSKQSMSSGNSSTASAKGGVRRVIARGIDDAGCAGAKRKSFGFMFAAAAVVATAISDNDDDIGADDDANHGASKNTELKVSKKLKRGTKTKAKAKAKAKANKDEDRSAPSISAHPKESNDEETLKKEKKKKKKKKKVKKLTKDTKNNSKAKGGASGPEGGVDEIDSIFG